MAKNTRHKIQLFTIMKTTLSFKPRNAIVAAFIGMWLLASLGVFIVVRCGSWSIFPSSSKVLIIAQLGCFYLAYWGAHLPAIGWVALVITHSTFRRPVMTAGLVTLIYEGVMFGLRLMRRPWSGSPNIEWWMPIGFELIGIIVLMLLVMVMSWILERANKIERATATTPNS